MAKHVAEPDPVPQPGTLPASPPAPVLPAGWLDQPRRRAAIFSRADILGAVSLLSLVSLLGMPLAWFWSRLAPAQLSLVEPDGSLVPLPVESQHRFDDLAVFVLLGAVAGLLTGVAVWLLRQRRGPLALIALTAGSLIAAWLAMRTGISFAEARYSDAIRQASPGAVVATAPRLETGWAIVIQPLLAALAYGSAAAASGSEDLGRRLS